MRWLAGPLVAAVAVGGTLLVLEGMTRLHLPASQRAQLPHVGMEGETQRRLWWVERSRGPGEARGWELDVPDALLGWRPRAGARVFSVRPGSYDVTVTINAQGLRGSREVAREKPPGVARIAVFGCSQTFGSGVEDDQTFSARLASALPGVEALNFGVHGYGTDQMVLRWEHEGVGYVPDVVVLAFAYYHLDRNVTGFRFYAKPRFVPEPDGTLRLAGVPVPDPAALAREPAPSPPWPLADRSVLLRWLWDRELRRRDVALYRPEGPAWDLTRTLIARFAASARRHGARMILLNLEDDAPQLSEPLGRLAAELGVEWVDAGEQLSLLRRQGTRLRLPDNPHWNAQGHAAIAEALRVRLCTQTPLPGCGR